MYRILVLFGLLLIIYSPLSSKHIIGGEATFVCTSTDGIVGGKVKYDFTFIIYRDKLGGGADYDTPANFGIYIESADGTGWEPIDSLSRGPQDRRDLILTNDPCVVPPNNLAAEKAAYYFSYTFDILSDRSYMVAYQRCCRNNTINNIYRPEEAGAAYLVEVSQVSQISGNSSPYFKDFPPLVICAGTDFSFDHSAFDDDGDSLVYSYYNPLHAGGLRGTAGYPGSVFACDGAIPSVWNCPPPYSEVYFVTPYSYDVPLGGAPIVGINKFTGLIRGTPNVLGQFVVGVKVEEYRAGELIGTVFRDFQFNVTTCDPKIYAEIVYDDLVGYKKYVVNSCGNTEIDFINISQDPDFIFDYIWVFDIAGKKDTFSTWNASVNFPGVGDYKGKLILNPGTQCIDSADIFVNVYPDIVADFEYAYDTCVAGPVYFTDNSYTGSNVMEKYIWDLEEDYKSFEMDPTYVYETPGIKNVRLIVEDKNECLDTTQKEIPYFPAPAIIVVEPTQFKGCVPAVLGFQNLSIPIDSTYTTIWSFGDGGSSEDLHPVHSYDEAGVYDINISITSPIGCSIERSFPSWITIKDGPVADFYYEPGQPSIINNTISFFDESIDAAHWEWRYGDGFVDFNQNPTHTYQDTGIFRVDLLVTHPNHCVDTLSRYIDIKPVITYFMPNAFSPNGDGENEEFKGSGFFIEGMKDFSLRIFTRWGNMIFETKEARVGWNGRRDNAGELLPQGVYIYQLDYTDARGEKFKQNGFATLVR